MPGVGPASYRSRRRAEDVALYYEESWMAVPFEHYEGMTQQQFQEAVAPYVQHGAKVRVSVPAGWRRVEGSQPGRHLYVHVETGAVRPFPAELYDCRRQRWLAADGAVLAPQDLALSPQERVLRGPAAPGPRPAKAAAAPPAAEPKAAEAPARPGPKAPPRPIPGQAWLPEPALTLEPPLPVALLFPGQGSQYVKMMGGVQDLPAVQAMAAKAAEVLGMDIMELCLRGPAAVLDQTRLCQPAMFLADLAAMEKLRSERPDAVARCQAMAGLSLGEYAALTAAGVLSFEAGLRVVKLRAEAMQDAADASPQALLSVAGLDRATVEQLCEESAAEGEVCRIANVLFPGGFACAGSRSAVERLMARAHKVPGCLQAKLVRAAGAFHTPLMAPAKERLLQALREAEKDMRSPRCDVYMNCTARRITPATPPSEIVELLAEQLCSCVLWEASVRAMIADGISRFFECGPMKQLRAMMKRIDPAAFQSTSSVDV